MNLPTIRFAVLDGIAGSCHLHGIRDHRAEILVDAIVKSITSPAIIWAFQESQQKEDGSS